MYWFCFWDLSDHFGRSLLNSQKDYSLTVQSGVR